ncbi:MAG: hypothetical protein JSV19_09105 [Phycisphaerales bacterium]|nr:MAG: hypothetical protein JSV19_09105 [Phycisphaerales bacterium]
MTRTHRFVRMIACFGLFVGVSVPAPTAVAGDPAELVPADSIAFVGWSSLMNAKEQAQLGEILKAVRTQAGIKAPEQPIVEELTALVVPVMQAPGCLGLLDLGATEKGPDLQVALVLEAGGQSEDMVRRLDQIIRLAANPEAVSEASVDGVAVHRASFPQAPVEVFWGSHGQRFFATLGEEAARKTIARLNGQGDSLASAAELNFARGKVKAAPGAAKFEVFVDLPAGIAKARQLIEQFNAPVLPVVDAAIQGLGINSMKSFYAHSRDAEEMPVLTAFLHVDGPRVGLLSLWEQQPLSDEDVKVVPRDARWAAVWNLDVPALWKNTVETAMKIDARSVPVIQGGVMMAAGALGFTSLDEMWSIFGDTWAVYDAPDHGGLVITGAVLVAEVKNREALEGVLSRAMATINTFAQGNVTLMQKQTTYGEHTIQYVLIGGVPCPVAPAWGFAGDRWVFGLFPQTVAVAMQQVDAKTRTSSILDHPDFQAARKLSPTSVLSLCYLDTRHLARLLYPLCLFVQTAGVSQLAPGGLALDLQTYPPVLETLEGVHNCVMTASTDDDGIVYVLAGSGKSGATVAAAGGALAALGAVPAHTHGRTSTNCRGLPKQTAGTGGGLKQIGTACIAYAIDNEEQRYPGSLQELLEAGVLTPEARQLLSGRPGAVSYVYIHGQTMGGDPQNVLAYERLKEGEGTHVCFADGRVEWMPYDAFKRALLATYQRLGREDEMPPEFRP